MVLSFYLQITVDLCRSSPPDVVHLFCDDSHDFHNHPMFYDVVYQAWVWPGVGGPLCGIDFDASGIRTLSRIRVPENHH